MRNLETKELNNVNGGVLPAIVAGIILADFAYGVYEGFTSKQ